MSKVKGFYIVRHLGGDRVVVECSDCGKRQGHYTTQDFECQYHCDSNPLINYSPDKPSQSRSDPGELGRGGAPAASGKYSTSEKGGWGIIY